MLSSNDIANANPLGTTRDTRDSERGGGLGTEEVIPLIGEQLEVGKRTVTTGVVRLHKHAEERTETINLPLTSTTYHVEHVPLDRVVAEAPTIRQEGETTIYPVVEERLVVTRELRLREEVRVTRTTSTTLESSTHTLLREEISVDREPA